MDASRVEGIGATILSRLAQKAGFEKVYQFLLQRRPTTLVDFCEAWIGDYSSPCAAELQNICLDERLCWDVEGRLLGWKQKEGAKDEPIENAEVEPLRCDERSGFGKGVSLTGADGGFRVTLPPGRILFEAKHKDWRKTPGSNLQKVDTSGSTLKEPQRLRDLIMRPARSMLVYAHKQSLWMNDELGESPTKLRDLPRDSYIEGWSPDRQNVLLKVQADGKGWDLGVAARDGNAAARILVTGPLDEHLPSWSPDGRKVAFLSTKTDECAFLYVVDIDGKNLRKLTNEKKPSLQCQEFPPTWNPSSTAVAFVKQNGAYLDRVLDTLPDDLDIWSADVASGALTPVSRRVQDVEKAPSWSPDGRLVAFIARPPGSWVCQVWVATPNGDQARAITSLGRFELNSEWAPSWSPDGTQLAFFARGLCVCRRDGSNLKRIAGAEMSATHRPGDAPTWSPDGRHLAMGVSRYERGDDDPDWIYVVDSDGSNLKRLGHGHSPAWLPELK